MGGNGFAGGKSCSSLVFKSLDIRSPELKIKFPSLRMFFPVTASSPHKYDSTVYFQLITYQGQAADNDQYQYESFEILVLHKEIDLRTDCCPQFSDFGSFKTGRTHTTDAFVVTKCRITVRSDR